MEKRLADFPLTISKYIGDPENFCDGKEHVGLEACDDMDGVFYEPPDFAPLEQNWGRAMACYGPIPKYRGREQTIKMEV